MKRTYYTNGINEKRILPDESIPKGWHKGRVKSSATTTDCVWINNGKESKFIYKTQLIPNGWVRGRIKTQVNGEKTKQTILSQHRHWYNNGEKQISLAKNDSIPSGYILGRLPMTIEQKEKLRVKHVGLHHTQEAKNKISKHSNNNRKKAHETIIHKYSSLEEYYNMIHYKGDITKRINNSFNTSIPENDFYYKLCEVYGKKNIFRNYKSKEYPFKCDFYIKSIDKYIELNLHWTHGSQPYIETNKTCQEQLKVWQEKAKTSQFYENAIQTWTVRDVNKLRIAKENNLNYEVIY